MQEGKGMGCLAALAIIVVVAALSITSLVSGVKEATSAYWLGKSNYLLTEAAANAIYADTRAAHGFNWNVVGYVGLVAGVALLFFGLFFVTQMIQQRRLLNALTNLQTYSSLQASPSVELPACLPEQAYIVEQAPERQHTYIQF